MIIGDTGGDRWCISRLEMPIIKPFFSEAGSHDGCADAASNVRLTLNCSYYHHSLPLHLTCPHSWDKSSTIIIVLLMIYPSPRLIACGIVYIYRRPVCRLKTQSTLCKRIYRCQNLISSSTSITFPLHTWTETVSIVMVNVLKCVGNNKLKMSYFTWLGTKTSAMYITVSSMHC